MRVTVRAFGLTWLEIEITEGDPPDGPGSVTTTVLKADEPDGGPGFR